MQNSAASLGSRAFTGTAKFVITLAAMIFLPAGSVTYGQGWVFLVNFSTCAIVMTIYFLKRDPALLERRLRAGPGAERQASQKIIQLLASVVVCAMVVASALDHRFGWSDVPMSAVVIGNALVVLGFAIILVVFRENSFASATIEVGADQKVISTGPYAWVRHPMYAGAIPLFSGVPLALGSWWALLVIAPLVAILVVRLLDEERYLVRNLPGYAAYCTKVRYRLLPALW